MRRAPVLTLAAVAVVTAALAVALAGSGSAVAAAARADGTPAGVITRFVQAAGKGDAAALWALLSRPTRKRLGPDLATFRTKAAPGISAVVGELAHSRGLKVALVQKLSTTWAIAAMTGTLGAGGQQQAGAYAVALRGEGGGWRVELAGPVTLRVLGPDPGEVVVVPETQFAVEAKAPSAILGGVLYADGKELASNGGGTGPRAITFFAPAVLARGQGSHFGAAIVATSSDATAIAWTFAFVPAASRKPPPATPQSK